MRPRAILLIYGECDHHAQIKRLQGQLKPGLDRRGLAVVGICEKGDTPRVFPACRRVACATNTGA